MKIKSNEAVESANVQAATPELKVSTLKALGLKTSVRAGEPHLSRCWISVSTQPE